MATSKDNGNKGSTSGGNVQKGGNGNGSGSASGSGSGSGSGSSSGGSGTGQAPAKRGFAAMDEQQQREIASKGGHAAHQKGTAHEFDSEEARRAGQKGGESVSRDREHMADIGRKGGESRQSAARANAAGEAAGSRSGAASKVKPPKDKEKGSE